MDIPRLEVLYRSWRDTAPPVHVSVAAYIGWGRPEQPAASNGDFEQRMASAPMKDFTPHG